MKNFKDFSMNKNFLSILFMVFFGLTISLNAENLDGTTSIKYRASNVVFRKHEAATGFVILNNGFTALPNAEVTFNVPMPISSGMDLRETGTLTLGGDLYLDSNFTISASGNINGNDNAIFLGGDLTFTDSTYIRVIHIKSDTIIDGKGHNLILGQNCKLFVDDNVTLTLKNLVIKPTYNELTDPCIKLASHRSKLALDNVIFNSPDDFYFGQGQLFFHNDVLFTGMNSFIYKSTQPSFISSHSTLYYDTNTTFSITPATFTDQNFHFGPTGTSNAFIKMHDKTSKLYLDNCSLKTTLTGASFYKGTVNLKNSVTLKSNASNKISSPFATLVGSNTSTGNLTSLSWSPSGKFLTAIYRLTKLMRVFSFNGTSAPVQVGSNIDTGGVPECTAWSSDGRFFAVVSTGPSGLQIFSFSGSSTPILVGSLAPTTADPSFVSWSSDGKFLAVVNYSDNSLQVFSFDGINTPVAIAISSTGLNPESVAWSPNGKYIAVANTSANTFSIFSFDGISSLTSIFTGSSGVDGWPLFVAWSPDGRFLAIINNNGPVSNLRIMSFNGFSTYLVAEIGTGSYPQSCSWSPDGKFVLTVASGVDTNGIVKIFSFNGSNDTLIEVDTFSEASLSPESIAWSPDGRFFAMSTYSALRIYSVNYSVDDSNQALSNSIVFKDLSGIESEANLNVLGGAQVELDGLMCI